jgi:photosystem II stability/assembly factor-like uncharacterized protein
VTAFTGRVQAAGFVDVLDAPARSSALASKGFMQAVTRAGDRLVAVGQRGHVVVSLDGGANWTQSAVPVSSDLTAVYFIDARRGWAVGHDGVVLYTGDGGDSWRLQLDGRKANALILEATARRLEADPASAEAKKLHAEAQRFVAQGADKPFLDVWFADAAEGYVVGAYNLIFRTGDGGATWAPWFDRTDNPKFLNLYAVRPVAGELYVAGESGLVMKLDAAQGRFRALDVPYQGSFFGLAAANASVLAYGLRGSVFRSDDAGRSWVKVDAGLRAAVVAAAHTATEGTLLADAGGRVVASHDGGRTFRPVALRQSMPLTGLADVGTGRYAVTGPRGVSVVKTAVR